MNVGSSIFVQLMDLAPRYEFNKCVSRWVGKYQAKKFSFWDQFLCMSFAQLTHRESLRDIETCLRATSSKLYHCARKPARYALEMNIGWFAQRGLKPGLKLNGIDKAPRPQ